MEMCLRVVVMSMQELLLCFLHSSLVVTSIYNRSDKIKNCRVFHRGLAMCFNYVMKLGTLQKQR